MSVFPKETHPMKAARVLFESVRTGFTTYTGLGLSSEVVAPAVVVERYSPKLQDEMRDIP